MGKRQSDIDEYHDAVSEFYQKQQKFKSLEAKFKGLKEQFNDDMQELFDLKGDNEPVSYDEFDSKLVVSRTQRVTIQWNPMKLVEALGKSISKQVVLKRYMINDMPALVEYLKECGVDPKVFKSFLDIEESVDQKELERLEELGRISKDQLKGCYTVKCQKPYFTVVRKGGDKDEE